MRALLVTFALIFVVALSFQAHAGEGEGMLAESHLVAANVDAQSHAEHCAHLPCDCQISHAPCACGYFAHSVLQHGQLAPELNTHVRVAFADDNLSGRDLLPPVPPPL